MKIVIDAHREGYTFDQVRNTMTVGELIEALSDCPPELPVYIGNDRQSYGWYTYGGITYDRINEVDEEDAE